jgi:RNA polymerase sigma-70 factor (ECF subfamily)
MISDNGFDRDFKELYESLFLTIFRIAYRITGDAGKAEDLCHEAFIKYYERGKPLPDMTQAKYWLIRVVKNLTLNSEKRKSRERRAVERLKRISPLSAVSEEETYIKKESKEEVQKALSVLPYNFRIVLILKEYEGLTYKEIGSIMGITEGNVKVRVFRAREKLSLYFKEAEQVVS